MTLLSRPSAAALVLGIALGAVSTASALSRPLRPLRAWLRRRGPKLSPEERWIEATIRATMPPAAKLGIGVEALETDASGAPRALALASPLSGNTNVHGTAFAGSLYSISALCAWCARARLVARLSPPRSPCRDVLRRRG